MANSKRVDGIAESIAALGYEGIVKFDREEPEFECFTGLNEEFDDTSHLKLLGICAGIADYQLAGDAQRFWATLEETALDYGRLASVTDVEAIIDRFMDQSVNARLNQQKRSRLDKLFDRGFADWFIDEHDTVRPLRVWEHVAEALDNPMQRKTVVFSMKVYDIIELITAGQYLDFPDDIPIPVDLQVKRVAMTSGLSESAADTDIRAAWAAVASAVNDRLDANISMLRIDSIVWQAGQIIGSHQPEVRSTRNALVEHFRTIGIETTPAEHLADELTKSM